MNPSIQRLLMSAAQKINTSGWSLENIADSAGIAITAIGTSGGYPTGTESGDLMIGNTTGKVIKYTNSSWTPITYLNSTGQAWKDAEITVIRPSFDYSIIAGKKGQLALTQGVSGFNAEIVNTSAWGETDILSLELGINTSLNGFTYGQGTLLIGGSSGKIAWTLMSSPGDYLSNFSNKVSTIPGWDTLGTLGDVVSIIYKGPWYGNTPPVTADLNPNRARYDGDTSGWFAFSRSGRFVVHDHHWTSGQAGITNDFSSGWTERTSLRNLIGTSGDTLVKVIIQNNKFIAVSKQGNVFLSYDGIGAWESRGNVWDSATETSLTKEVLDFYFDGQYFNVLTKINGVIKLKKHEQLTHDQDELKIWVTDDTQYQSDPYTIFHYNGKYYVTGSNGRLYVKTQAITPVNKSILTPMVVTVGATINSTPFTIYFDFFNLALSRFESADLVILNDIGEVQRASVHGTQVSCQRVSYQIGVQTLSPQTTRTKLSISRGNTGKVRIFGRRYGFQTIQYFDRRPEITDPGFTSPISEINQWGNAQFLRLDGAFASNQSLQTLPTEEMPPFSFCDSLAGMFANCSLLNSFPKLPSALGAIESIGGMLYNCREFNQPIVSSDGGQLNTFRLANASYLLNNAIKFNNKISLVLNGTGSPVASYTKNLSYMFYGCSALTGTFDNSITNLSFITDSFYTVNCQGMFYNCRNLNVNLNTWNTSRVTDMSYMFHGCNTFNGTLNSWDTGNVTNMRYMFQGANAFNQPIGYNSTTGAWNTGNVTNMSYMFSGAKAFNQPIGTWDTSKVTDMSGMFQYAEVFNQNIGNWNTANVIYMVRMFMAFVSGSLGALSQFNNGSPIGQAGTNSLNWNVSKVVNAARMFSDARWFNSPINFTGAWQGFPNTIQYFEYDIDSMFEGALVFNQPLNWDLSKAQSLRKVFKNANAFNGSISGWKIDSVTTMYEMFRGATAFNQPIDYNSTTGAWNTSNVTSLENTFYAASAFNQPIGNWNTSKVTNLMYTFGAASSFNQPIGNWNTGNVLFLQGAFNAASAFNQPLNSWNTSKVINLSATFAAATAFNQPLNNWNTSAVTDMSSTFAAASSFNQPIGTWNTANVIRMSQMFDSATLFNQDIGGWNTGKVTTMYRMFFAAAQFNQSIGSWNTQNVTTMEGMFTRASKFNQPIGGWNTGNVTNMANMFDEALVFNQPIGSWNTSKVTNMSYMFARALAFNKNLSGWCVTQLPSQPLGFNTMDPGITSIWIQPKPQWGTCPAAPMPDIFSVAITSNQVKLNLSTYASNQGWDGNSPLIVTINPGVYIYSDFPNDFTPGLFIQGTYPNGITLNNYGNIIGAGGGGTNSLTKNGGPALRIDSSKVTINNFGNIAGGGGRGGTLTINDVVYGSGGGGGAGGGAGLPSLGSGVGGTGGSLGQAGTAGSQGLTISTGYNLYSGTLATYTERQTTFGGGGGGGRILPGSGGTNGNSPSNMGGAGGGSGGAGGSVKQVLYLQTGSVGTYTWVGGTGGSAGQAGSNVIGPGQYGIEFQVLPGAGGGGWGAPGGSATATYYGSSTVEIYSGGLGGPAIIKTQTFTLNNNGNVYGSII